MRSYAPINVKPLGGGRPGKGGGFDCNHRPVVGVFDRFNDLSSNILLTFGCYFDNPQCSGLGHLNENSQLSSNAPPMPGLPPPPPPSGLTLIGALVFFNLYFQKHNNAFQFSEHVSMFQTSSSAIMNICKDLQKWSVYITTHIQ